MHHPSGFNSTMRGLNPARKAYYRGFEEATPQPISGREAALRMGIEGPDGYRSPIAQAYQRGHDHGRAHIAGEYDISRPRGL